MAPNCFFILSVTLVKFCHCKTVFDNVFADIRNKPTFVDKTPLIYEFLQHKYLFITTPSKFGKTTNLDMIDLFLSNHRSKQTIENVFIWTNIWENEEFVKNNIGNHPVIQFNLKVRGYSSSYDQTLTAFKVSLYNAFIDHMYLLESEIIGEDKLNILKEYTDLTKIKLMDTDTFSRGLGFLAELLHQHHKKPVILLADEFGRGITEGILKNHLDLSSVVELYSSILNNTFQNASIISHAMLMGENWIYGVKSPAVSLFDHVLFMEKVEFSRFFGFTYDEVESLLTKFNISKDKKPKVLKWYGGYSTADGLFKVCNPFSILQYLPYKDEEIYWTGSALAPDLIRRMVEVEELKKHVINLVMRKPAVVDKTLGKATKLMDVNHLRLKVDELPQYCENFFLQMLVETGYLTFDENENQSKNVSLKFPNEEVHSAVVKFTL